MRDAKEMLGPETVSFYREAMQTLAGEGVPFLIGGAHALDVHTGVARQTKDLDVFVERRNVDAALAALEAAGLRTERPFPHWLAKAFRGDDFVDLIYGSGNGLAEVDEAWFEHAVSGRVFGVDVRLCPVEEMIWSKAFILERERYDGADIAHLIQARGAGLDWARLIARFGLHWPVLLSQLVLFGYVFPSERDRVPSWVMASLLEWLREDLKEPPQEARVCRGTLVSRAQYLVDLERGFRDARLDPDNAMTAKDVEVWTKAIDE
jgi:hypothetical protein